MPTTSATPAAIVRKLNDDADWWSIRPRVSGERVLLEVAGEVYPFRADLGRRVQRGKVVFAGEPKATVDDALRSGLNALDLAQGPDPELIEDRLCRGSGARWGSGTGQPICPVCHRGPRSLGVNIPTPARYRGGWGGLVPEHERRT
jgi:hypothetical protein